MTEPREIVERLRAWAEHERVESYVPSDATRQSDLTEATSLIEQLLDQEGVGAAAEKVATYLESACDDPKDWPGPCDSAGHTKRQERGWRCSRCHSTWWALDGSEPELASRLGTYLHHALSPATTEQPRSGVGADEAGGPVHAASAPRSVDPSPDCETCGGSREGVEDGGVCPGCGTGVSARPSPSGQNETDENPGTGKAATTGGEGS